MKRKLGKQILALTMIGAMSVGLLSGCGGSKSSSKSDAISIFLMKDDYKEYSTYNDNPVVQYLEKEFDIDLDFQQPAIGTDADQFNLMLSTGDFTDVMEVSSSGSTTAQKLYEDGIIMDLSPYLEEYMPHFVDFLEEHPVYKKAYYTADGKLYTIPMQINDMEFQELWGGFVYRRDILETMTDGNVAFPSGNDEPTTIDDWTYMMGLMKSYYEQQGVSDYACLILPSTGYVVSGELTNGFGTYTSYYMDGDQVVYGSTTEQFYNYLNQMKEWYEDGYIYADFASRTGDSFYTPNPSLVNSGNVGIWYGTNGQLAGNLQSSGVEGADVRACASPLDAANGQDGSHSGINMMYGNIASMDTAGYVVSADISEDKLIAWLQLCDYLFTDEGAMLSSYGLDAAHGAGDSAVYQKMGLEDGVWNMIDGEFVKNEAYDGNTMYNTVTGFRLPGKRYYKYDYEALDDTKKDAIAAWGKYGFEQNFPGGATKTTAEAEELGNLASQYGTYQDTMVVKFIIGTEKLDKNTFQKFCEELESLGTKRGTEIKQTEYDRYISGESN